VTGPAAGNENLLKVLKSRVISEVANYHFGEGVKMAVAKQKKVRTRNKDRMNFHLAPEIKERVARAAAITGQELTDFAVSALSERADEVLARHEDLLLTSEDYQFFLGALDEDQEPSGRSRAASERHRRGRREGVRYRLAD